MFKKEIMKAEELKRHTEEMVKYLLSDEASKDAEIVEGYTNTFIGIAKEYASQHKESDEVSIEQIEKWLQEKGKTMDKHINIVVLIQLALEEIKIKKL